MNYRECRQNAIYYLLKSAFPGVTMRKTFLLLGGIKNGLYFFDLKGIHIIGLSGCAEINCPGIFEDLRIEYEEINAGQFEMEFNEKDSGSDYAYMIPVVREMLNTDRVDLTKMMTIGHSFFMVKRVEGQHVFFINELMPGQEYYVSMNVLREIDEDASWMKEAEFKIYKIDLSKLRENTFVYSMTQKSEIEMIAECARTYWINGRDVGEQGTVRLEGDQVFEILTEHLNSIISHYERIETAEGKKKFRKYIYFQMINLAKHMSSGSDGYYRTEFYDVLKENTDADLKQWEEVIAQWRRIGRKLAGIANIHYLEKNAVEAIGTLIREFNMVKELEYSAMGKLKDYFEMVGLWNKELSE